MMPPAHNIGSFSTSWPSDNTLYHNILYLLREFIMLQDCMGHRHGLQVCYHYVQQSVCHLHLQSVY